MLLWQVLHAWSQSLCGSTHEKELDDIHKVVGACFSSVFPHGNRLAEEEIDHYNDDFVLSQEFMW